MNLRKVLTPQTAHVGLQGETKDEIIAELVDLICGTGRVKDRDAALSAVLERERKMSTGMEHGVAIPHGKTDAVDGLFVALATRESGIDFDSLDGQPARIFVMTLSPKNRSGPHIQFLAEVSRLLRSESARQRVLEATTPKELIAALTSQEPA